MQVFSKYPLFFQFCVPYVVPAELRLNFTLEVQFQNDNACV